MAPPGLRPALARFQPEKGLCSHRLLRLDGRLTWIIQEPLPLSGSVDTLASAETPLPGEVARSQGPAKLGFAPLLALSWHC